MPTQNIVRYVFEHVVLPEIAFRDPLRIARLFEADSWAQRRELQALVSAAKLRCLDSRLLTEHELDRLMTPYNGAGGDTIVCTTQWFEEFAIRTLIMPPPEISPDAHMVAITQAGTRCEVPARYFTLEVGLVPGLTTLVERQARGGRRDLGTGPRPVLADFVAAVSRRLR